MSISTYHTGTLNALGPRYSFSHEAAAHIKTHAASDMDIVLYDTIEEVWMAMHTGNNQYGLVPFENYSSGTVMPNVHTLIMFGGRVVAERQQPVNMCIGGIDGAILEEATTAYSHPKGLEQCSLTLRKLPITKLIPTKSTAAAPIIVATNGNPNEIALASRFAIEAAGLKVLEENAADLPNNITQMYIVQDTDPGNPDPEAEQHLMVLQPEHNQRGTLARVTGVIAEAGVNLRAIHSMPIGPETYSFLVAMQREGTPEKFAQMIEALQLLGKNVHLGSWNDVFRS